MAESEKVTRSKILKVRVSSEEEQILKMLCTKSRLAEWMRETCMNYGQGDLVTQSQGPVPADPALLRELASIGNNLNQIARKVNSTEWGPSDTFQIVASLKALESELSHIRDQHR